MKREEAIELKAAVGRLMYSNNKDVRDYNALIDFIESALRPVSRERVEKVFGVKWEEETYTTVSGRGRVIHSKKYTCSACGKANGRAKTSFCPACGRAMTDEAVQMVIERMEELHNA